MSALMRSCSVTLVGLVDVVVQIRIVGLQAPGLLVNAQTGGLRFIAGRSGRELNFAALVGGLILQFSKSTWRAQTLGVRSMLF